MKRLFLLFNIAFAGTLLIATGSSAQPSSPASSNLQALPQTIAPAPAQMSRPTEVITTEIKIIPGAQDTVLKSSSEAARSGSVGASGTSSNRWSGGERRWDSDRGGRSPGWNRGGGRPGWERGGGPDHPAAQTQRGGARGTTLQRMRDYYINKATGRDSYSQGGYRTSGQDSRNYYNRTPRR